MSPRAVESALEALRGVSLNLPHLSGLAAAVRVKADERVSVAGVFASGLILVNPTRFPALSRSEALYVMAHELMHLALRHHDRGDGQNREMANIAEDYIINDMLTESLGMEPPVGGLYLQGAREYATEALIAKLLAYRAAGNTYRFRVTGQRDTGIGPGNQLGDALVRAGLAQSMPIDAVQWPDDDLLPASLEADWFPSGSHADQEARTEHMRRTAAQALSLGRLQVAVEKATRFRGPDISGSQQIFVGALGRLYQPPWELALQRWMEGAAPAPRSYSRPSRRGGASGDAILPGRTRGGWTLNIVLDTSGSMMGDFPRVLTAIAGFCDGQQIERVRVLQCDAAVTEDRDYDIGELRNFAIHGLGGSDMSPALLRLAEDPEVTSAIVITDGWIAFPREPMPYNLLWVVTSAEEFAPAYGQVIRLEQTTA